MSRPVLTLLYVPASREERVHKALSGPADVVIVDLEDAVAPAAKDTARGVVARLLADPVGRPVQVRVNALGSPWAADDLAMVRDLPGDVGVRVPKVTAAADVTDVVAQAGQRSVHSLLESARGVEAAAEISRAPHVASIGLGEADLRSDLGVADESGLSWCRQRIVVAARAAGLPPPAMAVYPNVADLSGLAASCRAGRAMGFLGRSAIHPRQLSVIEAAFLPREQDVARAREVVDAVGAAVQNGDGTAVLADGTFLDVAMIEQARRILELAERGR